MMFTPSQPKKSGQPQKSLLVTYICWLFGGLFGLHHFYLGRDRHAFITWITAGGYFGCGFIRDLWRIPEYVKDANNDPDHMERLWYEFKRYPKPQSSWARDAGAIIVADIFGYLVMAALPNELIPEVVIPYLTALLVPPAIAVGIHLVGNVGRHRGSIKVPLTAAYASAPIYIWYPNSVFITSIITYFAFCTFSKQWRTSYPPAQSFWRRVAILTLASLLYLSLWASWGYFNCTLTDKDGQEYKCRDSIKNSLNSPFFQEFKSVMRDLYIYVRYYGVSGLWTEFMSSLDPSGEASALKTLDLPSSASQEEITSRYRKLSRQWHPDRHKDAQAKKEASEKFMAINSAYETLSSIKSRRMQKNQKHDGYSPHQARDEL